MTGRAAYRCPRCNGVGRTARPPWVPGDVDSWTASGICDYECSLCNGDGLVFASRDDGTAARSPTVPAGSSPVSGEADA